MAAAVAAAGAELRSLRADFEDAFAQLYIRSGSRTTIPLRGTKTRPIILYLQNKGLGFSAVSAEAALIAFMLAVPFYFGIDALYRALVDADFHLEAITPIRGPRRPATPATSPSSATSAPTASKRAKRCAKTSPPTGAGEALRQSR